MKLNWKPHRKGIIACLVLLDVLFAYRCFYWSQCCNQWLQTNQAVEAYRDFLWDEPEPAQSRSVATAPVGSALERVQEFATNAGIRVDSVTVGRHKPGLYSIRFAGSFAAIVTFLSQLEGLMPPLVLTITSMQNGSDGISVIMTAQAMGESK